ncbi:MAG: glycosyltransferase family 39 protein [Candidatus Omnitrophica bacterium]|nr:glycosyltransferase family 39 protein [Candidatus Omnitrophota bacterium]
MCKPKITVLSEIWPRYILSLIVFIGALIRIQCLLHHLPALPAIDENIIAGIVLELNLNDLNPHNFIIPHLFYYLLWGTFCVLKITVLPLLTQWFSWDLESIIILSGRAWIAVCSIFQIGMVYRIGKKLFTPQVGLIAAAFLSVNPFHVMYSCEMKADMVMVVLLLIAFYYMCDIFLGESPMRKAYVLSGLWLGLAIAAKYHAFIGSISLYAAGLLKAKNKFSSSKYFLLSGSIAAGIFFLCNFSLFFDIRSFLNDVFFQLNAGLQGFPSYLVPLRRGWWNYPGILIDILTFPVFICAIGGMAAAVWRHSKKDIFMLSFPFAYYFIMGFFMLNRARYMLPLLPWMVLFAGWFLMDVMCFFKKKFLLNRGVNWILLLACAVFLGNSIFWAGYYVRWMNQKDTRIMVRQWASREVPHGARILSDSYGGGMSFVFRREDPYDVQVIGEEQLRQYENLFRNNEFDFIILKERYPQGYVKGFYDYIDQRFLLIKEFIPRIPTVHRSFINTQYHPMIKIYASRKNRQ